MPDKIIAAELQVNTSGATAGMKQFNQEVNATQNTLSNTNKTVSDSNSHFSNLKNSLSGMPGPLGSAADGVDKLSSTFKALLANPVVLVITAIVGALTLLYKAFTSTEEGGEKVEQIMAGLGAVVDVIRDRVLVLASAVEKFFKGDFKGAMQDAKASVNGFKDDAVKAYNAVADATKHLQEAEDELNRDLLVSRAKLNRDLAATRELITDETAGYSDRRKAIDEVRIAEGNQSAQELANAQKTLDAIHEKMTATKNVSADLVDQEAQAQARIYSIQEQSASDQRNLNRQSKTIEQQERQKDVEAHQKYLDQLKQQQANYHDYVNNLNKLRQENEIESIKDGYLKELRQVEIEYDNQKAVMDDSLKQRKISQQQYNDYIIELDKNFYLKRDSLYDTHEQDLIKKADEEFQKRKEIAAAQAKQAAEDAKNSLQQNIANRDAAFGEGDLQQKIKAYDSELAAYKDALNNKVISEEDYTNKVSDLAKKRIEIDDLEKKQRQDSASSVANTLDALSNIIGRQTAVGKGLAIATALINTWQGASEALKQKSVLPSPFDVIAKVANVATVIATGLNTVRQIVRVQVPGGGGGAGSAGVSAPSVTTPTAPITPQQTSTTIDQNSIRGIGDATSNRSYVLSSDVQRDADKSERLNRAARLGG